MKKMRKNNKGFSLVELIVVIAIMTILAVTLAPRLVQYVEKSRQASDQEAVHTIFTAAKLANLEDPLADGEYVLSETLFDKDAEGKKWTLDAAFPEAGVTANEEFWKIAKEVVGEFELKSSKVSGATEITLDVEADGKLTVTLDYDGTPDSEDEYSVSE